MLRHGGKRGVMGEKLICVGNIDGEIHRIVIARCDYKHVNVCMKSNRICNYPADVPANCKFVGKKMENCIIERGII